jgi:hypothetical protein
MSIGLSYAGRKTMTFYIFWMLCAVLAANVVVAFMAITKAYTTKGDLSFPNSQTGTN